MKQCLYIVTVGNKQGREVIGAIFENKEDALSFFKKTTCSFRIEVWTYDEEEKCYDLHSELEV